MTTTATTAATIAEALGLPTNYYTSRFDADGTCVAEAGWYADHRDATVRRLAWEVRQSGATWGQVTERLGLQHWYNATAAADAHGRRIGRSPRTSFTQTRSGGSAFGLLNRRFGVEIETGRGTMRAESTDSIAGGHPVTTAARHMTEAGAQAFAESYNHRTPTAWKVTYDSTVTGVEAVSPILRGDAGYQQVRSAMTGLKAAGAAVSGGCHVHHDVTDFTTQEQIITLIDNCEAAQEALIAYLPRSRRNNRWCRRLASYEFGALRTAAQVGRLFVHAGSDRNAAAGFSCPITRYVGFNFNSLGTYGTVEFRQHQGTLNPVKLGVWVAVGQAIVEASRLGHRLTDVQTAERLTAALVALGLLTERLAAKFVAQANAR